MTSVNTFVRSILDDLVEKRLWPVAAVLLIALIGIPVLLSKPAGKEPASAPVAAVPAVAGGPLSAFEPVVNTEGKKSSEIRKDLEDFATKNPFKPQNVPSSSGGGAGGSVQVEGGGAASAGSGDATVGSDSPPLGTPGAGGGDPNPDVSAPGTTQPQTFYYTYAADVRFGKEGNLDRKTLQQFRSLPSTEDPVLVFMGVKEDGETAIFLLSSAASSTGEGNCEPDDTCTFLYMKEGDEQRIEAVNSNDEVVTYEFVLLGIEVKRTDGPEKAQSSGSSKASKRSKRSKRSVENVKEKENPFARGFQAIGF